MPWHGHLELAAPPQFVPGALVNQLPHDSPIGRRACDLSEESEALRLVSLSLLAVPGKRPRLAVIARQSSASRPSTAAPPLFVLQGPATRYNSRMLVIVRPPGAAFRDAISTHPESHRIDVSRARAQHAAFCAALEDAGLPLLRLPEEPGLPDATFVSDSLVALAPILPDRPPVVVVARPAVPSRRLEVNSVLRAALSCLPAETQVVHVEDPGTLEGGDVVVYGDRLAVGLSGRTNALGARVLADAASIARIPTVPLPRGGSPSPRHGRHRRAAGHAHRHCRRLRLVRRGRH